LESERLELSVSIHPLKLSSEHCWFLGIIVFELVTNAARHEFHDGAGSIPLEVLPAGTPIECCITDNGATDAGRFQRAFVEALAQRLHANVDMQSSPGEIKTILNCRMSGPRLAGLAARPGRAFLENVAGHRKTQMALSRRPFSTP
jgi:anti-sigma regulatory factor (Ser/Thr protein kinase)